MTNLRSIHADYANCFWTDQSKQFYYILVDEASGQVGEADIMLPIEVDQMNAELRLLGNPWRWFRIDEKERAA
jgi:hypothetical protein